ncbi:MAG: tubulin-like doman-containing protein [Sulfobacillus sp.]
MKLAIAIGGTGARCLESLVHLTAAGLLSNEALHVLVIDADPSNGNVARLKATMTHYNQVCCELEENHTPFFRSRIDLPSVSNGSPASFVWSPIRDNRRLSDLLNYPNLSDKGRALVNLLFSSEEQKLQLDQGFRGHTSIGAAAMGTVKFSESQEPWHSFIEAAKQAMNAGESASVFVFASIFGGTGASGFPVIGDFLRSKLASEGTKFSLGGALVLPYFQFAPSATDRDRLETAQELYARSDQFMLATKAALEHYAFRWQNHERPYNSVYLVGDVNQASQRSFSVGGPEQRNRASFVELIAALGAADFFSSRDPKPGDLYSAPAHDEYGPDQSGRNSVTWPGLPSVNPALLRERLLRFASLGVAYCDFIFPIINDSRFHSNVDFPWYVRHFSRQGETLSSDVERQRQSNLKKYFEDFFFPWLTELHGEDQHNVQLFNSEQLLRANGDAKNHPRDYSKILWRPNGKNGTATQSAYDELWNSLCLATDAPGRSTAKLYNMVEDVLSSCVAKAYGIKLEEYAAK